MRKQPQAPPVYRAVQRRPAVPAAYRRASSAQMMPVRREPRVPPAFTTPVVQRAAEAAEPAFTVVKTKATKKLAKKQAGKAAAAKRTYCDAWLQGSDEDVVSANSGLTSDAWKAIEKYAPKLAEKIRGTKEKGKTPAIACAEPQAVALFLSTYGLHVAVSQIRVGTAFDDVTQKVKAPCPNCSSWLEECDDDDDGYGNAAYKVKAAYC